MRARPRCTRCCVGSFSSSCPNSFTEPVSGVRSPVTRLNSVVLPAPFGPMISRRSPGITVSETSRVAGRPPKRLFRPHDFERGTSMRGASCGALGFFAARCQRIHSCRTPGTMPNGMNMMTITKIAPSSEFQRST